MALFFAERTGFAFWRFEPVCPAERTGYYSELSFLLSNLLEINTLMFLNHDVPIINYNNYILLNSVAKIVIYLETTKFLVIFLLYN